MIGIPSPSASSGSGLENGPRQAKSHAGQNVIDRKAFIEGNKRMSTETTTISAAQVKELRERSGAPMMDCKNALSEAKGDLEGALVWLRKKGIATAAKKAARTTSEGSVASYIHAGGKIGVLVEINCES